MIQGTTNIVFVDDMEDNRLAAQQFVGWQTCASIEELKELLK